MKIEICYKDSVVSPSNLNLLVKKGLFKKYTTVDWEIIKVFKNLYRVLLVLPILSNVNSQLQGKCKNVTLHQRGI